jgi:hypothetical protein
MSDFHPESWNPGWGVGTILVGLMSFMTSEEITTGSIKTSEADKKKFAFASHDFNSKEKMACELFADSQTGISALYEAAEVKIATNSAKLAKQENKAKPVQKAEAAKIFKAEPTVIPTTTELRVMNVAGLRQLAMALEVTLSPKEFSDKRAIVRKLLSSGKLDATKDETKCAETPAAPASEAKKQEDADAAMLALLADEPGLGEGAGTKKSKKKKKKKNNKQKGAGDAAGDENSTGRPATATQAAAEALGDW